MSWEKAMKEQANIDSRNGGSAEPNLMRSGDSTSWDPYEVWLTRVKEPRGRAPSRARADADSQVRAQPD
jgi:hypothetical protein